MGVVDDDLLFAADRYWQLGVSLRTCLAAHDTLDSRAGPAHVAYH